MNAAASRVFSNGYMKGFFDVIGAMLSETASYEVADPQDASPQLVADFASRYNVALQARVKTGGAAVVLLQLDDMRAIVARVMGEEPASGDVFSEDEAATFREVFDPCMGGGASHFKEAYGEIIDLQPTEIAPCSADSGGALGGLLGPGATASVFTYAVAPDLDSHGVLFFSPELEETIPPTALDQGQGGPSVSEDELSDILSKFDSGPATQARPAAAPRHDVPPNIDMVLDISLEATARLGRVEMSLGDILNLGPGSIIEVGHLVDEPVELLVNNKLIARGDVVVVDEKFGLRITEIVSAKERIESLH